MILYTFPALLTIEGSLNLNLIFKKVQVQVSGANSKALNRSELPKTEQFHFFSSKAYI